MDKFCDRCGTELVNGVCPRCSRTQNTPQPQQPVINTNPNDEQFKQIFMSPKEKFVCALGNGYLMNFLTNGSLSKGFAVVSDKRVYFKGKAYEIGKKKLTVRTSASTVDLKDVTGTEVRIFNPIAIIIAGSMLMGIGLLLLILMFFITEPDSPGAWGLGILSFTLLICSPIFLLIYKLSKITLISIYYAGGNIAFDIRWYPAQESENFQKLLRQAKDAAIEEAENATANAVRAAIPNSVLQSQAVVSSADELAKYAQMFKDGILSEQEFSDIKAKLLAKQ